MIQPPPPTGVDPLTFVPSTTSGEGSLIPYLGKNFNYAGLTSPNLFVKERPYAVAFGLHGEQMGAQAYHVGLKGRNTRWGGVSDWHTMKLVDAIVGIKSKNADVECPLSLAVLLLNHKAVYISPLAAKDCGFPIVPVDVSQGKAVVTSMFHQGFSAPSSEDSIGMAINVLELTALPHIARMVTLFLVALLVVQLSTSTSTRNALETHTGNLGKGIVELLNGHPQQAVHALLESKDLMKLLKTEKEKREKKCNGEPFPSLSLLSDYDLKKLLELDIPLMIALHRATAPMYTEYYPAADTTTSASPSSEGSFGPEEKQAYARCPCSEREDVSRHALEAREQVLELMHKAREYPSPTNKDRVEAQHRNADYMVQNGLEDVMKKSFGVWIEQRDLLVKPKS